MRFMRKSGQISRSKNRPRPTLRSGRGSRTNSNTSHQIQARVIEAGASAVQVPDACRRRLIQEASNMTQTLVSKTCTPCRGGIPPLAREQAELFPTQTPEWQLRDDADRIEREILVESGHSGTHHYRK